MTLTREQELKNLKSKRSQVKDRVARVADFVDRFTFEDNINSLKARLAIVTDAFTEFNKYHYDIVERVTDLDEETNDQVEFESLYYSVITKINSFVEKHNKENRTTCNSPINQSSSHSQKASVLPAIQIPEFNGNYENWLSFRDLYKTLIHDNKDLTEIEKFHYLRSSLVGEALRTIEGLSLSSTNYLSAWNLLEKRFENKRLIVHAHVRKLLNFQNITKTTYQNIRQLLDEITINLEALKQLQIDTITWDPLLVPILSDKLDYHSSREWQSKLTNQVPTVKQFTEFLETRCQCLESINYGTNRSQHQVNPKFNPNVKLKSTVLHSTAESKKRKCLFCKNFNHFIYQCNQFRKLSIADRINHVKNLNACANCLRPDHNVNQCPRKTYCRECNEPHNTLLHVINDSVERSNSPQPSTSNHCGLVSNSFHERLLQTAIIFVKNVQGQFHKCRALLDPGSQLSLITKSLCNKLGLKIVSNSHEIRGIGGQTNVITEAVRITINSIYNDYSAKLTCSVLPDITNQLPTMSFPINSLDIPKNIQLADQNFNESSKVDLLIGTELYFEILRDGKIHLKPHKLYLQNSHLGWIIGGVINVNTNSNPAAVCNLGTKGGENQNLSRQLEAFWTVEGCNSVTKNSYTKEEVQAETHFANTFNRDDHGRFMVSLPVKDDRIQLGNSEEMARRRFLNLEKRLSKNLVLKLKYSKFIKEYLELGHMELVPESQIHTKPNFYLPHHAIFKETSPNSKLRVVFDASAKSNNGLSLNDNLLVGPTIQSDLLAIILRFRTFQFVLSADIIKMYRQIWVEPEQTNYQRIFWRNEINESLQIYRLKTVTYGTASAPFLAVRVLHQLALDNKLRYPQAADVILNNFYMDDVLTGHNNLEQLREIRDQLIAILNSGGFELSKWAANNSTLLPSNHLGEPTVINLDKQGNTKTLGLFWNCSNDTLQYNSEYVIPPTEVTKRTVLSAISKTFDPLGLISPIIIRAKVMMQELWSRNLDWDIPIPRDMYVSWQQLIQEINNINHLRIPRKVIMKDCQTIELHGFSDSSEKAYGIAIYLKSINSKGNCEVHLLVAKSRVAPLKTQTIPRLELLAAHLLAQMSHRVLKISNLHISTCHYWTDSEIVLAWLSKPPSSWKTFVSNRVAEIQNLTNINELHHVKSKENPADIISRGTSAQQLANNKLWWHGPTWLIQDVTSVQSAFSNTDVSYLSDIPELKTSHKVMVVTTNEVELLSRFSSFTKLTRVTAYVLRFVHNCRFKQQRYKGHLSSVEIERATHFIVKSVQSYSFAQEIKDLRAGKGVNKKSSIANLDPFLDNNQILRVGGRLRNTNLPYSHKHPILLPNSHYITELLVNYFHIKQLHAGAQATLSALRQSYWLVAGRSKVRQILHKCVKCFRVRPTICQQKMGDLPVDRLEPARPFINTGVDYCGPVLIKEGRGRGKRSTRAYICLFVCLCTKAVHIELVTELTTECFLNALKRLIARRGYVKHFRSDNATNFTGARKDLKELSNFFKAPDFQNEVVTVLASDSIKWSFSPPRSPNLSGLMEAAVKSAKYHLKRVIGETLLTFEEMYTLLTRIEACLNSRPLIPLTSDPNDLTALTPGHFLVGEVLTAPLEHDLQEVKLNRLSRWQVLERIRQHFWQRWKREVVSQMQTRSKWSQSTAPPLQPGTMVLLAEDNVPPLCWPLGRVQQIHPGRDGVVRVVTVRTSKGVYKRGISKICVLPMDVPSSREPSQCAVVQVDNVRG